MTDLKVSDGAPTFKEVRPPLSTRLKELLEANVVSIHMDFFGTGTDIYARVTQPHPRLGLYPHESYSLRDIEDGLSKINLPKNIVERARSSIARDTGEGTQVQTVNKPGFDIKKENGLVKQISFDNVWTILPDKALTFKEVSVLSTTELFARMVHVVNALGQDKIVSRVETDRSLGTLGTGLSDWWRRSSGYSRFKVLSNNKQAGAKPTTKEAISFFTARLEGVQCPFRDTNNYLEESSSESEKEEEGVEIAEYFKEAFRDFN